MANASYKISYYVKSLKGERLKEEIISARNINAAFATIKTIVGKAFIRFHNAQRIKS